MLHEKIRKSNGKFIYTESRELEWNVKRKHIPFSACTCCSFSLVAINTVTAAERMWQF